MLTLILVILAAVIFEYSNGFHDAANAIATVVSTRVLTPRQAIAMAAFFNLTGALFGGAVAATIGKGLVDTEVVTMTTVLCAVIAAFSWNIATWWFGLPSSSSHALIGGLCGAALAAAKGEWSVIKWNEGVWPKVVLPMIGSPIAGFVFGALFGIAWGGERLTVRAGAGLAWPHGTRPRSLVGPASRGPRKAPDSRRPRPSRGLPVLPRRRTVRPARRESRSPMHHPFMPHVCSVLLDSESR